MKIKLFKFFESRNVELTEKEFLKLLSENCQDFLKKPKLLFRSEEVANFTYAYRNPMSYERTPAEDMKTKHHMLLMDNLPSWSNFPKRRNCIIGLTAVETRISYFGQHRFFVIPYDGAKFGVAPSEDLWSSVSESGLYFDEYFVDLMESHAISDDNYEAMMNDFEALFQRCESGNLDESEISKLTDAFNFYHKTHNCKTALEALNFIFDPNNFRCRYQDESKKLKGFKVTDYDGITKIKKPVAVREFWTSSECLMLYIGWCDGSDNNEKIKRIFSKFIKEIKNEIGFV